MKKIGIMQPYLFPYLGYFQLIRAVDEYVIYDDVQYIKGGWINRNNILVGGQKVLFTFKLDHASPNKKINEINLADDFSSFLKTIEMAYHKAPFFSNSYLLIKNICSFTDKNLARFAGNSIIQISEFLGFKTRIIYSSDLPKDLTLSAQDKVISICKFLNGSSYLNAIGGTDLYDKETFKTHGLELRFLKPHLPPYEQFNNEFIPGLSIIDVLMFNSPEDIKVMLENYELV